MTIYETIDSILATVKINDVTVPFFYGMQEFSETFPEPNTYLIYTDYNIPANYAGNEEHATIYTITINIFSPFVNAGLMENVKSTMKVNGFIYQGGGKLGIDSEFPYKVRHYQEFTINF